METDTRGLYQSGCVSSQINYESRRADYMVSSENIQIASLLSHVVVQIKKDLKVLGVEFKGIYWQECDILIIKMSLA